MQAKNMSIQEQQKVFESSFNFVAEFCENLQQEMIETIKKQELLPIFYQSIFEHTHKIGKIYSEIFLLWNRKLMFEINPELEKEHKNNTDAVLAYLEKHKLFDTSYGKQKAERCYSILENSKRGYVSKSYRSLFPELVEKLIAAYGECIETLASLDDDTFHKEQAYIDYYQALRDAWAETDPNICVEKWDHVDRTWMKIDTPIQPGHPMEYYEDAYRHAVSIESDLRVVDPSLFESEAKISVSNMYEAMFDEIGRENFPESYQFSKKNLENVGLYI